MWSKFKKRYKRINITNKIKQTEKKENSGIDLLFKKEKEIKKENDFFYYYKRDSEEQVQSFKDEIIDKMSNEMRDESKRAESGESGSVDSDKV